ncbi:MAG: pyruvate kinase [Patescibacteria group bacterium]
MKRTKIVCTIGPASKKPAMLEKMIKAGMNMARLNFSHGTHADHARLMKRVLQAAKKAGTTVAILQDLQGPKIRVGDLSKEGVKLVNGSEVIFTTASVQGRPSTRLGELRIPVGYKKLHQDVKPGDRLLLDDGLLEVMVQKVSGRDIVCHVVTGGMLTSHKGMNFPTATLSIPALTPKDKADVAFGVRAGVDYVALSFVRSAKDVMQLRALIAKEEKKARIKRDAPIMIISKIEKPQALDNFDEILDASDAIMVARGDLGVETPAADVPVHQKRMIEKCLTAGKPVIVATQMLDSMIRNPRPTRAEVSDIANAVIDHTDAVMLSGETATGAFPLQAVKIMAETAEETEKSRYDDVRIDIVGVEPTEAREAISKSAAVMARMTPACAILSVSVSGRMGRRLSRFRPEIPIVVGAFSPRVARQLALSWGVTPILLTPTKDATRAKKQLLKEAMKRKLCKKGNDLLFVMGSVERDAMGPNRLSLELFRG